MRRAIILCHRRYCTFSARATTNLTLRTVSLVRLEAVETASKQGGDLTGWYGNQASAHLATAAITESDAGVANVLNRYPAAIGRFFDPGGQVCRPAALRRSPNIACPGVDPFAAHAWFSKVPKGQCDRRLFQAVFVASESCFVGRKFGFFGTARPGSRVRKPMLS